MQQLPIAIGFTLHRPQLIDTISVNSRCENFRASNLRQKRKFDRVIFPQQVVSSTTYLTRILRRKSERISSSLAARASANVAPATVTHSNREISQGTLQSAYVRAYDNGTLPASVLRLQGRTHHPVRKQSRNDVTSLIVHSEQQQNL